MMTAFLPGSPEYASATEPDNTSVEQHPAAVVVASTANDAAEAVALAAARGWRVAPQATGHGNSGDWGDDVLLLDTSGLADIEIRVDEGSRTGTARVGAGATWQSVQAEAEERGMLGLSGTAPTVGVAGYTFGSGIPWFVRPHGLAASHLSAVEFVDGRGTPRRAAADAPDAADREALWAFRGGQGVGVATALEFDLVPSPDLWAGYLLWPVDALDAVVEAWASTLDATRSLNSCLSVLHTQQAPPFPEELQGQPVVQLSLATTEGSADGEALFAALERLAPTPVVDTWAATDAAGLGVVHLDPPAGTPAYGTGRWLGDATPRVAARILRETVKEGSPLTMVELRHTAAPERGVDGAVAELPGSFLLHGTGARSDDRAAAALDAAFDELLAAAGEADTGVPAAPFYEGRHDATGVLDDAGRARLAAIRAETDPDGVVRSPKRL